MYYKQTGRKKMKDALPTLCWWLSLLFADYIKNGLLSMKKNILHSHHLAENREETMICSTSALQQSFQDGSHKTSFNSCESCLL